MRLDVKKFLFIGIEERTAKGQSEREKFFRLAQQAGFINFISNSASSTNHVPQDVQDVFAAIKVLRELEPTEQEELEDYTLADSVTKEILVLKHLIAHHAEELRTTNLEIVRIEPFGDFSIKEMDYLEKEGQRTVQFFCARRGKAEELALPDEIIYINSDNDLDYFISISKQRLQVPKMIEMHVTKTLGELETHKKQIELELHESTHNLKKFAKYNQFLHHAAINKLNKYHLVEAQNQVHFAEEGSLYYVEGWVPVDKVSLLFELVKENRVYVEEIAIEPTDVAPTYLENTGIHRVGEDLVHIYDTPSNTDKDPSMWVLVWFALFFALIVGDGGYGLAFLITALVVRYKVKKPTKSGKRFITLLTLLASFCIGWGVLMNSFLGIEIPLESPLRKVSLLNYLAEKKADYHLAKKDDVYQMWIKKYPHLKGITDPKTFIAEAGPIVDGHRSSEVLSKFNDNIMMEIALMLGTIHILLSLLRYLNRNWSHLGWIIFIFGCYLYIPKYLHATSIIHFVLNLDKEVAAQQGIYLVFGGAGLAVFLAVLKSKLLGIFEVMNAIQIFADVMSYLRLYALGLAGGIVAATINEIAGTMPFVLAIVLMAGAHLVNMLMGAVSGVIHGLRLNFLEWYHYSFEGGGKKFNPLREIEIE